MGGNENGHSFLENGIVTSLLLLFVGAQNASAWDCNTDCGNVDMAKFRYPCPTFGNPGRKCDGRNPTLYAACSTDKEVSCRLWESIEASVEHDLQAVLEPNFNHRTYAAAEADGQQNLYMGECEAAGVAACGALGAKLAALRGAAFSGAAGVFISYRICDQSQKW